MTLTLSLTYKQHAKCLGKNHLVKKLLCRQTDRRTRTHRHTPGQLVTFGTIFISDVRVECGLTLCVLYHYHPVSTL